MFARLKKLEQKTERAPWGVLNEGGIYSLVDGKEGEFVASTERPKNAEFIVEMRNCFHKMVEVEDVLHTCFRNLCYFADHAPEDTVRNAYDLMRTIKTTRRLLDED